MEILRNHTNTDLGFLTPIDYSDTHTATVTDLLNNVVYSGDDVVVVQGDGSKSEILLPSNFNKYDLPGYVTLFNGSGNVIFESGFSSVMPYCNISDVATKLNLTTADTIMYERIARYIIDSKTGGFKFVYKTKEVLGNDTDYLLINERIHSINKIYENEKLIFEDGSTDNEYEYYISPNKVAIIKETDFDQENRIHYKKVWKDRWAYGDFNEDYDYLIQGEFGYFVIPFDISQATELLIQDLSCGNNRYLNKYIDSIKIDGFTISYFEESLFGTGNLIVDNILQKYGYEIQPRVM